MDYNASENDCCNLSTCLLCTVLHPLIMRTTHKNGELSTRICHPLSQRRGVS